MRGIKTIDVCLFIDLFFSALQKMPFNLLEIYLNSFDCWLRRRTRSRTQDISATNAHSVEKTKHTFFGSILISIQMNNNDEIKYKLCFDCICFVDTDTVALKSNSVDRQWNKLIKF